MSPVVSATLDPARWRIIHQPRRSAALRLYCFPFAGGGPSFYRDWGAGLPADVEVRCVQLPGRQGRRRESSFVALDALVSALADALEPELGEVPFAYFGHSMGALVAYELTRLLRHRGGPAPALLAVSAHPAPDDLPAGVSLGSLPDLALWDELRRLGGIPDEIGRSAELRALFLPALRADLRAVETYAHLPEPPLTCPITVFGGTGDALVPRNRLAGWHRHTVSAVTTRVFRGGHFYLQHNAAVVRALAADVARAR